MGKKTQNPEIITASEIAAWAWCPESWRLDSLGHAPENRDALARGERRHALTAHFERWSALAIKLGLWLLVLAVLVTLLALFLAGES